MVAERKNMRVSSSLERFLGSDAQVQCSTPISISNHITCYFVSGNFPSIKLPEDEGKLSVFPLDDDLFYVELFYSRQENNLNTAVEVIYLRFLPEFFRQFPTDHLTGYHFFNSGNAAEIQFPVCAIATNLLETLLTNNNSVPLLLSLGRTQTALQLLGRALDCINVPFAVCQVPACKFLADGNEREKIMAACKIIEQELDTTYTIRELARKVAMNECYLKKGFRSLTGKTIHEFREDLRINKSKELLQKGTTVTDVANILGFSSISHFSTAFKRVTGMKPCDLLS
jgi:AraC-like DNA-binding protein